MQSTAELILRFAFGLISLLFWFRFLLQASNADRFNPISQAVIQASDKICGPLRAILPHVRRVDLASLIMTVVTGIVFVTILHALSNPNGLSGASFVPIIISGFIWSLYQLTQFFFFAIIIMVIASFVSPGNYNPALALIQSLLEPVMGPLRRVLPPMGPLDLSPMVALLIIFVLQNFLRSI